MHWYKEIEKDRDFIFQYTEYDRGISVTPSDATAVVYDNQGNVVENITGDITGDLMEFKFTAAQNTSLGKNFKIEMTFTTDAIKTIAYLFDVVNIPIENVVTDEMLFDYIKELRNGREVTGLISGSTVSSFTDTKLTLDSRNWKGGRGTFLGESENTDFKSIEYDQSSGTITFTPTLSQSPTGNYIIRMSYQDQIDNAYKMVLMNIRKKVGLAAGYIDTNVFNTLIIYKCLETICLNEIEINDDKWEIRKNYYESCYNTELNNFYEAYDRDNDGNISDEEDKNRPSFSVITNTRVRECQESTRQS